MKDNLTETPVFRHLICDHVTGSTCLPQFCMLSYIGAGFCPDGYGYMMKRVLATGNDRIVSTDEGVSVNGHLLPLTQPLEWDKAGRKTARYPFGDYKLWPSELLLMSDVSATSFDGRYFGPVKQSQIKGVIEPLITF